MNSAVFVTGNQDKADYMAKLLGRPLAHQKVDLPEVQAHTVEEVVELKVKEAYKQLKNPVIVEDVGLGFAALGNLPGPFIKFFVDYTGLEATCRMLDSFTDRSATAVCVIGYYDGEMLKLFTGSAEGVIAEHPRGEAGFSFGWDKIFMPEGYGERTRAELTQEEYDELYLVIKPISKLRDFLNENDL